MAERLRIGVIGCGVIAQVMHLHYLRELADRFEIAAVCDLSASVRSAVARDYAVPAQFESWQELVAHPLDAVLVLTPGSHAPAAVAAAKAGLHVLVEKPMCYSVAEGKAMIDAAESAGVTLMVAYMKRYDPAYLRLAEEMRSLQDLRMVRITTLESPIDPYVKHYELHRARDVAPEVIEQLGKEDADRVTAAIGDVDPLSRRAYSDLLLISLVHELNAMRGLLGEPDSLDYADIRETGLTAAFRYGPLSCLIIRVDLPGIARYSMEFALYSPERRLVLSFPSPFLRSAPTILTSETGTGGTAASARTEEITSYEEAFKRELIHFHECVTEGRRPVTSGVDCVRDIALCEAIVTVHRSRTPLGTPSEATLTARGF